MSPSLSECGEKHRATRPSLLLTLEVHGMRVLRLEIKSAYLVRKRRASMRVDTQNA